MRIVSLLIVVLSVAAVWGQEAKKEGPPEEKPKLPAELAESLARLKQWQANAPSTLAEAHTALERILSPQTLAEIDAMPAEKDMGKYHFSLGLSIRNGWGLWTGSPLAQHMEQLGFTIPDNMSGVILGTFWCKRHGQDFRLKERAAESNKALEDAKEAREKEANRIQEARTAMRNMMMGLRFERRDVPIVRMPDRTDGGLRVRFLCPFRNGVFLTAYRQGRLQGKSLIMDGFDIDPASDELRKKPEYDYFVKRGFYADPTGGKPLKMKPGEDFYTEGFYFDPLDRKIHRLCVNGIDGVYTAVVAGETAWFGGQSNGKLVLAGVGDRDCITLPLPQEEDLPDLGWDGRALLAVYPKTIFRLTNRTWSIIHSGDILLPRSGLPPQRYDNMVLLRDEGRNENDKRLWWLTLGEQLHLSTFDHNVGVIGEGGPRWENSFSYCVTSNGDLWVCAGESHQRKSLLRRSKDGSYSIAIMNNSVRFTENLFGSAETDQGLSISAVAALPDNVLLLVGDAGLYRLKGKELVQELAFTNTRQDISTDGRVTLRWKWDPSNVLVLEDHSYFIGGAFGGVYLLSKGGDGQWSLLPLDEKLGDPVVW